jgi:hypothetical protein
MHCFSLHHGEEHERHGALSLYAVILILRLRRRGEGEESYVIPITEIATPSARNDTGSVSQMPNYNINQPPI